MESRKVEPEVLELSEEEGVSDALRESVEEEMEFLKDRELKLVRMRADDAGEVFQITIHAGDEMYRMSEVAPGHVSRTVFRNPEKDGAMPYQDDGEEKEVEEETDGEEDDEDASKEDEGGEKKEEEGEDTEEAGDEDDGNSEDAGESEEDGEDGEKNEDEQK